jgi:hypothetical protein
MSAARIVREMCIRDLICGLDEASKALDFAYDLIDRESVGLTPRASPADIQTIISYRRALFIDAQGAVDDAANFLTYLNRTEIERSLK